MEVSGRMDDWVQPESRTPSEENKICCDPCEHDGHHLAAEGYCVDCQDYLCAECFSVHRRPVVWRHHQVLNKELMPKIKPASKVKDTCTDFCPKHTNKIIEFFCTEHETFGCSACMTTGHRSCTKVDYIPEVAATFDTSEELTELQTNLVELVKSNENNKSDTDSKSKAVGLQAERAKTKIKDVRNEIIEVFDRLEKVIDMAVDEIKSSDETKMGKLANETETISNDLKNHITEIETKLKEKEFCALFIETKRMREYTGKIAEEIKYVTENNNIQRYHFEPDPTIVELKQKLSEIGTLKVLDDRAKVAQFEGDINAKAQNENEKCRITGISLLSDNLLVAADVSNKSVKLFDIQKKELLSIYRTGEPDDYEPFDVTEVKEMQIAVTYRIKKTISFLSVSEAMDLKLDRAIAATGDCHGIACIGSNLFVSFNIPPVVKILTMNGQVIKTIKGDFDYPDYVAVNPHSNTKFISNWTPGKGSLTCVTADGKVTVMSEGENLILSRGITVDKSGSVFVVCSGKVLQFSQDGKMIQELLKEMDGITGSHCITLSEDNKLYIGLDDDKIKMFKIC